MNTFKFNYDHSNFEMIDASGIIAKNEIESTQFVLSKGGKIEIKKQRFNFFKLTKEFIINDDVFHGELIKFKLKKIGGTWLASTKIGVVKFEMNRGHNYSIYLDDKKICHISLNEIEFEKGNWQYIIKIENENLVSFPILFLTQYIMTYDTEGTRMPSSLGNIRLYR